MTSIKTIQPFVFLAADNFKNVRQYCDSPIMDDFDLLPWIEESHHSSRNIFDISNLFSRSVRSSKAMKNSQRNDDNISSRKSNPIHFSVSGLPTPLPGPIEINIKIQTNDKFSTVTKRKTTIRPILYDPLLVGPNKPVSEGNYFKPMYELSSNSYYEQNDVLTTRRPLFSYEGVHVKPDIAEIVSHERPHNVNYHQPSNSYNVHFSVSNTNPLQRPTYNSHNSGTFILL